VGETNLGRMTVGVNSAGEGTRVLPGLHGDLSRLSSGDDTGRRRFGASRPDAARQLDGVCFGGQRRLGRIESSWSVRTGIFDRGTEVLGRIHGRIGLDGGGRVGGRIRRPVDRRGHS
jgi:hypothetical protein